MNHPILNDPRWWSALTLAERRATLAVADAATRSRGERRLRRWRTEKDVTGGVEVTLSRWLDSGLSEEALAGLLGEGPEQLHRRLPAVPEWLRSLADAWRRFGAGPAVSELVDGDAVRPANPELTELAGPLLRRALSTLADQVEAAARDANFGADLRPDHPVLRLPLPRISQLVTRVVVLEMHVARMEGRLRGETAEERFAEFATMLRDPDISRELLAEYPVLARALVEETGRWQAVRAEFAARLAADAPALRAEFGVRCEGWHDVTDVRFEAGDTHRGGRTVVIVTFADGGSVVYKPRSLAVERHFGELLRWLSGRRLSPELRPLRVLDRGDYGWVEFAPTLPCADEDELSRFYWRQGAFLALLHTMRATDLHLENVVASGEHPVFVDLEAIFGGRPALGEAPPDHEIQEVLGDSVLSVGLLPRRLFRQEGEETNSLELSGLSGAGGQLTPMPIPTWVNTGTDQMSLVRERIVLQGAQNLPTLRGAHVDPAAHRDALLEGFATCYAVLAEAAGELARADGPLAAFRDDEIRVVLRPTMVYGRLLNESWHPDLLRDALDRECLFQVLAHGLRGRKDRERLVDSECAQLLGNDVPSFYTTPGSRDLTGPDGTVVTDFLAESGLDTVRQRVGRLSEADLARQRWCVSASFTALRIGEGRAERAADARPLAGSELDPAGAVAAAARIGDRLVELALTDPSRGRPVWLTLNLIEERYWSVGPTSADVYSGSAGIAFFLAHLAERTSAPNHRQCAEKATELLLDHVEPLSRADGPAPPPPSIGAFGDLGGAVYLLAHLGARWRSGALLDAAESLVPVIAGRLDADIYFDLMGGSAGAALSLLALHRARPAERTLAAATAAGETLLKHARAHDEGLAWPSPLGGAQPLLGLSHGAAGPALALSRLAEATGDGRFAEAADRAVSYEHRRYVPEQRNWPDLREISPDGVFMHAWCHGAPGIGLARAELALRSGDPAIREDLRNAVDSVRDVLAPGGAYAGIGNHSLCHGDLGLIETLLTGGQALADQEVVGLARRAARTVADDVLAGRTRCGVPFGVEVPGLLTGIAGVGYGLLRAASPDDVPNVLLVEPPAR